MCHRITYFTASNESAVVSAIYFFFSFFHFLASARKHPMTSIYPRATRNRRRSRLATLASLRVTASRFHGAGSGDSSNVRSAAASSSSACRSSSSASNTSWSRTVARLRYLQCFPWHGLVIPRGRRPCEQIIRQVYVRSKRKISTPRMNDFFWWKYG